MYILEGEKRQKICDLISISKIYKRVANLRQINLMAIIKIQARKDAIEKI